MTTLPPELVQAIQDSGGEPLRLTNPQTNETYVIVPEKMYQQLQALVHDDYPLTEQERLFLLQEAGRRAGWDDPELDVYEQYREQK